MDRSSIPLSIPFLFTCIHVLRREELENASSCRRPSKEIHGMYSKSLRSLVVTPDPGTRVHSPTTPPLAVHKAPARSHRVLAIGASFPRARTFRTAHAKAAWAVGTLTRGFRGLWRCILVSEESTRMRKNPIGLRGKARVRGWPNTLFGRGQRRCPSRRTP